MEQETLKNVIRDQRSEVERKLRSENIITREGEGYAKRFIAHPNILAVLGVRRCGKSIFSLLLSRGFKNFSYVNFDDERLLGAGTKDLNGVLQASYELYGDIDAIILDEVQNIPGWEMFASRIRATKKVIITGSNSKLLSGDLATHLTGRHVDFVLHPFSFREVVGFRPDIHLTEDVARARKALDDYISGSGFPEFIMFGPEIVVRIYEDIINKDCLRRHRIRNERTFRELAAYLISNYAGEFTYSKLSRIFGIKDVHTAKNYVSYLEEAFVLAVLDRFSPKLKQQVIAPKKAYAIDHGFCNFISFRLSKNRGKLFENIVCVDLLRRKSASPGMEVYYWKDHMGCEVDFVVKEGYKVTQLVQVCYDIDDPDVREREMNSLLKAGREMKCRNLMVITDSRDAEEVIKGRKVRFKPLWKWLLEPLQQSRAPSPGIQSASQR